MFLISKILKLHSNNITDTVLHYKSYTSKLLAIFLHMKLLYLLSSVLFTSNLYFAIMLLIWGDFTLINSDSYNTPLYHMFLPNVTFKSLPHHSSMLYIVE